MIFRLTGIKSAKGSGSVVQDFTYHHDPVGNVTSATDHGLPTVFFNNQQVDAKAEYTYDALYRRVPAPGREHAGLWKNAQQNQNKFNETFFNTLAPQLSDGQALQTYTQNFQYDGGGNLTQQKQIGTNSSTRNTVVDEASNRIATSSYGAQTPYAST